MPTCSKCKSEQPETAKFCSQCSQSLTEPQKVPGWMRFLQGCAAAFVVLVLWRVFDRSNKPFTSAGNGPTVIQRIVQQQRQMPITSGAATVNAMSYSWWSFIVPPNVSTISVNGHFSAAGGAGNDIECYILDEDAFVNFKNGHQVSTMFNSGKVTTGAINAGLNSPGTYYLVLDNRFSLLSPKAVEIQATLSYMQ